MRRSSLPLRMVPVVLGWAAVATAEPKVVGNQAPLCGFMPDSASCPLLRDDGMGPDEVKGDGIYTTEVQLDATMLLRYKILPSGTYGADEITQVGDCGLPGQPMNPTGDLLVPSPDVAMKQVRFYYDSRPPPDPTWAPAPSNRSGGDTIIADSPPGVKWVAVGGFQARPFDPAAGTVDLQPVTMLPGVLAGETIAGRDLAAGWEWKVLEKKGTYDGARKFGTNGWSITPCDSANVVVQKDAPAGSRIQFIFHARLGRLQTIISPGMGLADGSGTPPDLRQAGGPADLLGEGREGADMTGPPAGLRCNCQVGRSHTPAETPHAAAALCAGLLVLVRARRVRRSRAAPARGPLTCAEQPSTFCRRAEAHTP